MATDEQLIVVEETNEPTPKKIKIDANNGDGKTFKNLADFIPIKILSNNIDRKIVTVLGTVKESDEKAILILEKFEFLTADVLTSDHGYLTERNTLALNFINDIYHKFELTACEELNKIKTTLIYPATQKHIEKYQFQIAHLINETIHLYKTVTLPHILQEQFSLEWVYNILDHKSEQERIAFEDTDEETGFVLLPDLRWNGKDKESLHMLCIVRARNIKSIRDLNQRHLPLLKNIEKKGIFVIEEKFKLAPSQQRIFFHYQPSFNHLHIHFTSLSYEAPGTYSGKAHLLSQVISNIELMPDYYEKATIPFALRQQDSLFKKFEEKGVVVRETRD